MTAKPKLTVEDVEEAIGSIEGFHHNCRRAAPLLVRSGLLPKGAKWPWANP